jgi:hypothetical protein
VGRKRDKGFEMNVLVFVLIVITNVEGEEVKEEFGAWRNIKECVFLQDRLLYKTDFQSKSIIQKS